MVSASWSTSWRARSPEKVESASGATEADAGGGSVGSVRGVAGSTSGTAVAVGDAGESVGMTVTGGGGVAVVGALQAAEPATRSAARTRLAQ